MVYYVKLVDIILYLMTTVYVHYKICKNTENEYNLFLVHTEYRQLYLNKGYNGYNKCLLFYSRMSSDNPKVVLELVRFVYFTIQRRHSLLK